MISSPRRLAILVLLAVLVLQPGRARAAEYQFEDNVKDLFESAKALMAKDELEEAALEYENVLQIDVNHRDAGLAAFEVYLKLGAVDAAAELLGRFGRMGVDSTQQSALRAKLDGVRASPPPKRTRVFTAAVPARAPVPPAVAPAPAADPFDDGLGELDEPPAPKPAAPASTPASPASGAPAAKDDIDDLGL